MCVVGALCVVGARPIGALMNKADAEQTKYSSLLSQQSIERLREMYTSPESNTLMAGVMRAFGVLAVIGGVGSIAQHL